MIFRLRIGGHIGLPIMFLSLVELWPKVVQHKLLALIRQMEVEMPLVVEPPKVVEPVEMVELLGWWCRGIH
jgi:hypothetical protein